MKTKIVGILVCMLLIITAIPSISGNILLIENQDKEIQMNYNKIEIKGMDDNLPPVADFEYTQNPDDKFEFHFYSEGYSYDPDGEIIYWRWNFNDGTSNSVVENQMNTIYNFRHVAKHDLTVSLIVGDDGDPQEFGGTSKKLSIPSTNYNHEEDITNIRKENNAEKNTKQLLNSKSTVIKTTSNNFEDIDLYIESAYFSPNPPEWNRFLNFGVQVGEKTGNHPEEIKIEIYILGIVLTYTFPFVDMKTYDFDFKFPDGITGKFNITIIVFPEPIYPWHEINWSDNEIVFRDIQISNINQNKNYSNLVKLHQISYYKSNPNSDINNKIQVNKVKPLLVGISHCDLEIYDTWYLPKPPILERYLTIYFNILDEIYTYDFSRVMIEINASDIGINVVFDVDFNQESQEVFFQWPKDATGEYIITLTVYPLGGWIEDDWFDNSDSFSDGPENINQFNSNLSTLQTLLNNPPNMSQLFQRLLQWLI